MNRYLYSLLFYLVMPLALLRLLVRALKSPAYRRRWRERFGYPQGIPSIAPGTLIWVHAVSVGETLAAVPLVNYLLRTYPHRRVLVTTMTPTGSDRVRQQFGDRVLHCYLPYDLPGAMRRFVRLLRPAALVIMETELWPNLLHFARQQGVKTLLVNGRLSIRSARGYGRLPALTRSTLANLDVIAAQGQADADRFVALGANPERVHVTGSLKFDMDLPQPGSHPLPEVFRRIQGQERPVLVAASTRAGEEEKVLSAFARCVERKPELLLVLVPRHPERFNEVARLCADRGLRVVRRSSGEPVEPQTQVFLGDSMGEMWLYYGLADIAFVGGSLVDTGCHNVLEPAALGIPVLAGPSRFNFQVICDLLQQAGALVGVASEEDLAQQVLQLLDNGAWRRAMGAAGKYIVESNRGSLQRVSSLIDQQLE